ncbi:MAG: hypothetical protein JWN15_3893 [Firmicutes bacterium]|nr:hypothetical protein [Bacillota bacterium]
MPVLTAPERISHLFRRAGFGAAPAEVAAWTAKGLAAAVDALLTAPAGPESVPVPSYFKPAYDPDKLVDAQAYWLHRMVTTRYPLVEKMVLFWHGHFATGAQKGNKPPDMQQQNDLFRRHAIGSFPALLRAVGKGAAMLNWLDGARSSRKAPNENYAREVQELFTTGPGPYTEQDVNAAARAFTGWRVDRITGAVQFEPKAWDPGPKTFLGHTGNFGLDEVSDILSSRPETAKFLATKLWRFFASPLPDSATVQVMADTYIASKGEIRPVLRTLFLSDAFYADAVIGAQIKSPPEFIAGALRLTGLPASRATAYMCTKIGQVLYNPPNVAGWPGGAAWLGASTLLSRWNLGEAVKLGLGQKPQPALLLQLDTPAAFVDGYLALLCVPPVTDTTRAALLKLVGDRLPTAPKDRWELARGLIRTIIATPEYQTA